MPAVGGDGCAFSHATNSFSDFAGTSFLLTMIIGLLGSKRDRFEIGDEVVAELV